MPRKPQETLYQQYCVLQNLSNTIFENTFSSLGQKMVESINRNRAIVFVLVINNIFPLKDITDGFFNDPPQKKGNYLLSKG